MSFDLVFRAAAEGVGQCEHNLQQIMSVSETLSIEWLSK
jgi:hypothetical protein